MCPHLGCCPIWDRSKLIKSCFCFLADKRDTSCFQALFKFKPKKDHRLQQQSNFAEDGYFSEFRHYYGDQLDGQTQSYESFETMTTDSECYRGRLCVWFHTITLSSRTHWKQNLSVTIETSLLNRFLSFFWYKNTQTGVIRSTSPMECMEF